MRPNVHAVLSICAERSSFERLGRRLLFGVRVARVGWVEPWQDEYGRGKCACGGRVQRLRPLFGRPRPGLDCRNPVPWVCDRGCRRYGMCGDRRASHCDPCAGRHRRRVRAIALSGATVAGERCYFVTLAPVGDRVHCKRPACDRAPGCGHELCPCTVDGGPDLGAGTRRTAAVGITS